MRLQLDKAHLAAMLGDDEFYRSCPIFLFIRQSAQQAHQQYTEAVLSGRCDGCNQTSYMASLLSTFLQHFKVQADFDVANLQCVKDYLSRKKGYEVDEVVLPYKAGSTGHRLSF